VNIHIPVLKIKNKKREKKKRKKEREKGAFSIVLFVKNPVTC